MSRIDIEWYIKVQFAKAALINFAVMAMLFDIKGVFVDKIIAKNSSCLQNRN